MSDYFLKKRIFAVLFLIVVFGFSIGNFLHSFQPLKKYLEEQDILKNGITAEKVAEFETAITENLAGRMKFIETYAYVQKLMDKRESNNFSFIKDEEGFLHYASFYREEDPKIFEYAMRVRRLQDHAERQGTRVLFVIPPSKYDKKTVKFRTGMPVNDPHWMIDQMLFYLNRLGVETLDLRDSIPNETLCYEESFFRTDHHWTIPAAFQATCEVVDKLEESFGENLDPQGYYTDIRNYDVVTYQDGMFGYMGRKTGANFCGVEDFTALWPRYDGMFSRECIAENGVTTRLEGSFETVLMDTEVLTEKTDIYSDSQYSLYLNSLRIYEKIINLEKPDGCRILMIRDSYFSPVIAFMAPMCGEIDAIWTLEKSEEVDIESYVKENEFDYIIVEVYPYNLNEEAFNYFKEE